MTGGASRTSRLQYLSTPEPGGHQPRNRHDVNDPLLLALQKELTSNLLWVLVIHLLTLGNRRRLYTKIGRSIFSSQSDRPSTPRSACL